MFLKSVGVFHQNPIDIHTNLPELKIPMQPSSWLGFPYRQTESLYNYQPSPPSSDGGDDWTSGSYVGGEQTTLIKD